MLCHENFEQPARKPDHITTERLREVLSYDPETGIFTWRVSAGTRAKGKRAGCENDNLYVLIRVDGVSYKAHRLAWQHYYGTAPSTDLDHINGVRSDNRISNLRPATRGENLRNSPKHRDNKSGFKGVYWSKWAGKWHARIMISYKRIHLGFFDDPREASDAYEAKARELFGEFYRPPANDNDTLRVDGRAA